MNEEPMSGPSAEFEPDGDARREGKRDPIAELKTWFRDLKAHFQGALEEAREASTEKREELRADYERRTGRRKE